MVASPQAPEARISKNNGFRPGTILTASSPGDIQPCPAAISAVHRKGGYWHLVGGVLLIALRCPAQPPPHSDPALTAPSSPSLSSQAHLPNPGPRPFCAEKCCSRMGAWGDCSFQLPSWWSCAARAKQRFSNLTAHKHHLDTSLSCRFGWRGLAGGRGPGSPSLTSSLPADTPGPRCELQGWSRRKSSQKLDWPHVVLF